LLGYRYNFNPRSRPKQTIAVLGSTLETEWLGASPIVALCHRKVGNACSPNEVAESDAQALADEDNQTINGSGDI
jgi:hypothetical protein